MHTIQHRSPTIVEMANSSLHNDTFAATDAAARIDVVLFDYGQVLSGPPNPSAWTALLAASGLSEEKLHAAYWEFRHEYDRGALTGATYWQAVAKHAGTSFDEAQMTALLAADIDLWTMLNQPMVEWALRLQRAGVRTGVLSNIGDCICDGIRAKLRWLSGFEHCTWSYAYLLAKPDPQIYIKTAKALDCEPQNILFIDDREENITAAAALGMQTIHYDYNGHADFVREMRERGLGSLIDAEKIA